MKTNCTKVIDPKRIPSARVNPDIFTDPLTKSRDSMHEAETIALKIKRIGFLDSNLSVDRFFITFADSAHSIEIINST